MLVVAAVGGNALLRRGEEPTVDALRRNLEQAVDPLASLAGRHRLVVTHGNGPQVALLAPQAATYREVAPYPLDVLGAESEGMIGYLLEQRLGDALPGRPVATLLTQVEVDAEDPAFQRPTRPVGPVYDENTAGLLSAANGWLMVRDSGGRRRAVPSPEPRRIVELSAIRLLVDAGVVVVCTGGGGIPVVRDAAGFHHGVEAVVDKDLSAALLAIELGADVLLLLTDVHGVRLDWGRERSPVVAAAGPDALRRLDLAAGSMAPKAEAACRFAEATGGPAVIGALEDAVAMVAGDAGTSVTAATTAVTLREEEHHAPAG